MTRRPMTHGTHLHHRAALSNAIRTAMGLCVALGLTACTELEPVADPHAMDLQVMVNSLQSALRENERQMADLRAELDGRRQELSGVVVARAQLEGRLREIERRLTEARHIIDLQREELLQRRVDRERHSKLEDRLKATEERPRVAAKAKRGQKAVPVPSAVPSIDDPATSIPAPLPGQDATESQPGEQPSAVGSAPASAPVTGAVPGVQSSIDTGATEATNNSLLAGGSTPAESTPLQLNNRDAAAPAKRPITSRHSTTIEPGTALVAGQAAVGTDESKDTLWERIVVQAGDTLTVLARRYGVTVGMLRAMNELQHDRIRTGQRLKVPVHRAE
ncbi:MAG: LysM peptidoglycan-binding domain-containing protein [Nitrospiraceae bacterium]